MIVSIHLCTEHSVNRATLRAKLGKGALPAGDEKSSPLSDSSPSSTPSDRRPSIKEASGIFPLLVSIKGGEDWGDTTQSDNFIWITYGHGI